MVSSAQNGLFRERIQGHQGGDMENTKLIDLLNEALHSEYTDIFLYLRQASMVEEGISKTFDRLALMEMRHADNIAIQINILGGKSDWEFDYPPIKEATDEILLEHLEREKKHIKTYQTIIGLAEKERQDQLKLILKGIKSEEENHVRMIKGLLEKWRQRNEG